MYHAITRRPGIYTRKRDLAAYLRYYRVARQQAPLFLVADYCARKGM